MKKKSEGMKYGRKLFLLPKIYRKIGYCLLGLAFLGFIFTILFLSQVHPVDDLLRYEKPDPLKIGIYTILMLGLSFVAWTREPIEDELMNIHRRNALRITFTCVFSYVFFSPIIELFFHNRTTILSAPQIFIIILLIYNISFSLLKNRPDEKYS